MRIMRAYFMLLPLVLAACSFPTKQTSSTPTATEPNAAVEPTQQNKQEHTSAIDSVRENAASDTQALQQELKTQQKLALQNIAELDTRVGESLASPDTQAAEGSSQVLRQRIENLKEFNAALTQNIFELDQRVEQRRQAPQRGDTLKVYLSDLSVDKAQDFAAQPLVGHWVRGESRIVRLNENLLAENSNSEPLRLTFSERYQVLINDQLIGSFGPNRSKYEVDFDAPTADQQGTVSGTLTIRVQGE
ncbi:hypothetical protein [Marinomonas ostreistagni]|uniref:hypothetical protein n=1 Tax=Marinomonas ostreistagni TaxID=359209 RepID=UPI00195037C8|nr:hypothetical protein [Marinomonas ostreistagni]MBM6551752.1 hypothetical protein [Marinomonas ostreistagni]